VPPLYPPPEGLVGRSRENGWREGGVGREEEEEGQESITISQQAHHI